VCQAWLSSGWHGSPGPPATVPGLLAPLLASLSSLKAGCQRRLRTLKDGGAYDRDHGRIVAGAKEEALAQESELIARCGLYCGDCFNYKGEIADLARDLRKKLRESDFSVAAAGLSRYFKEFSNYEQCYQVLGAMVRLRCRRTCRSGGGPPACKMRNCCLKKGLTGCWACADFETCTKLDFLKPIHGEGVLKNLRRLRDKGVPAFLAGPRSR